MRSNPAAIRQQQRGVFLLEALIAILIFAMGILGIVALGATAINAQSDAQYRTDAVAYASEIVGKISATADRASLAISVGAFAHQPTGAVADCAFSGSASSNAQVLGWLDRVTGSAASGASLPGSTAAMQQILITELTPTVQQVSVTVCWKSPKDSFNRRHTYIGYVS